MAVNDFQGSFKDATVSTPLEVYNQKETVIGHCKTCWQDYISLLACEHLGISDRAGIVAEEIMHDHPVATMTLIGVRS